MGPIAPFQNVSRPPDRLFAGADRQQHSGDIAHHVMQKRIGFHLQNHAIALSAHRQFEEAANRLAGLAFGGAERAEIVLADQQLPGFLHSLGVERRTPPGSPSMPKRGAIGVIVDEIAIAAG